MRQIIPIFAALGLSLAATSLRAAPANINDCEKIQEPDAYNQCLARFGPVAHEHHLIPIPAGADRHQPVGRRHYHRSYRHLRRHTPTIVRHRHRKRMILN